MKTGRWKGAWAGAVLAIALLMPAAAQAAIACSVSSGGVTGLVYDPLATVATDTTGSVSISCTRLASDPTTLAWSLGVDNGLYAQGNQRDVQLAGGSTQVAYDLFRASNYTTAWRDGNSTRATGTLNFGSATTASTTFTYYLRVPARQTTATFGSYADTLTLKFYNGTGGGATQIASATMPVALTVPASCTISSAPGTVALAYTSFQTAAATATTSFAVTCSSGATYSMALDQTSGTMLGLNYSLAISPTGNRTGTGAAQSATITGTVAGGQSGTCGLASCVATQTRVLTITY